MNKFLYEYSIDVFSQNGEDGINKEIFEHLSITSGIVLEIGACDGFLYSNTANLWSKNENYKSILIESKESFNLLSLESKYENVNCFNAKVNRENSLEKIIDGCYIEKTNPNGVTIFEWISWAEENLYEFIGMSGFLGKHPGNMYFVRKDLKKYFEITKKDWKHRGILLSGGVILE